MCIRDRYYRAEAAREAIERREAMEARDREIDEERARKDEIERIECEAQDAEDAAYFARIDMIGRTGPETMPVSYTHLDVYKRQDQSLPIKHSASGEA